MFAAAKIYKICSRFIIYSRVCLFSFLFFFCFLILYCIFRLYIILFCFSGYLESTPKPQPSGRGFNLSRLRGRRSRSVSVTPGTPGASPTSMASADGGALRDLVHPQLNETLKAHNGHTFKLVKTGKSIKQNYFPNLGIYWNTRNMLVNRWIAMLL